MRVGKQRPRASPGEIQSSCSPRPWGRMPEGVLESNEPQVVLFGAWNCGLLKLVIIVALFKSAVNEEGPGSPM